MDTHQIEPELMKPRPRQIRCRGGVWGAMKPVWILLLPHMWIAVAAPFVLLMAYWIVLFPDNVEGTVVKHSTHTSKKSGELYRLSVDFQVNGTTHTFTGTVPHETYVDTADGQPIRVLTCRFLPEVMPRLESKVSAAGAIAGLAFGTLWCTIWCGIMFGVAYAMWEPALRSRALCRNGKAIAASITNVNVKPLRRTTSVDVTCNYEAVDKRSGRSMPSQFTKTFTLSSNQSSGLSAGKSVTLLYDEYNPNKSIIYTAGDYAAV